MNMLPDDVKNALEQFQPLPYVGPIRSPGAAAVLSFVVPGLGQIYCGRFLSAFFVMMLSAAVHGLRIGFAESLKSSWVRPGPEAFFIYLGFAAVIPALHFYASWSSYRGVIVLNMQQSGEE